MEKLLLNHSSSIRPRNIHCHEFKIPCQDNCPVVVNKVFSDYLIGNSLRNPPYKLKEIYNIVNKNINFISPKNIDLWNNKIKSVLKHKNLICFE